MALPIIGAAAVGTAKVLPAIIGAAGSIIGGGMGMVGSKKAQKRQLQNQKELNKYNAELNMQQWREQYEATSPENQVDRLVQAGLNPGLMYGMGGAGGSSAVAGSQSSQAPMVDNVGMGMMALAEVQRLMNETKLTNAQKENIDSSTELNYVRANKEGGVDTEEAWARINQMKQLTKNAEATEVILQFETELKRIEKDMAEASFDERVKAYDLANKHLEEQIRSIATQTDITEATKEDLIKQAKLQTIGMGLDNSLKRANIELTKEQTAKIKKEIEKWAVEIEQEWYKLRQNDSLNLTKWKEYQVKKEEMIIKKLQQEFNTSGAAKAKQWTEVGRDITGMISDIMGGVGASKGKVVNITK